MKTIYAVSRGEYSDYGIVALFSIKELAQAFMDAFVRQSWGDFNEIEEYQIDPYKPELRKGFRAFFIRMKRDGEATEVRHADSPYGFGDEEGQTGFDIHKSMYTHCFAKDREHAIKIANERRVQLIATGKWPE